MLYDEKKPGQEKARIIQICKGPKAMAREKKILIFSCTEISGNKGVLFNDK